MTLIPLEKVLEVLNSSYIVKDNRYKELIDIISSLPKEEESIAMPAAYGICPKHNIARDSHSCPRCWDEQREIMFDAHEKRSNDRKIIR